ncbi:MAG: family 43 glycosylhydrolase, partial [Clostridia bacterium]|nr:family 43 glycosylhydrolase [Clostridia bacterium]
MKKTTVLDFDKNGFNIGGAKNDVPVNEHPSFSIYGGIRFDGGIIKADRAIRPEGTSGKSAFVSYTLPEEFHKKSYIVDVDHIDKSTSAGILIGAKSNVKVENPAYFLGYSCSLREGGDGASLGIFDAYGWRAELVKSRLAFYDLKSLHYRVKVTSKALTFYVFEYGKDRYGIDEPLFVSNYEVGSDQFDVHKEFTPTVGLRQYYWDKGHFENFKITVIEDDELPVMTETLTAGATEFLSNGITEKNGTLSGNGALLSKDALCGNYRISLALGTKGISRIYFGMTDEKNGYTFEINAHEDTVFLYKIENGKYKWLGQKKNIVRENAVNTYVDVHDGIVSCYYDNYLENGEEFPKFEFTLEGTDGRFGMWLEDSYAENLAVTESKITLPEITYTNPINPGADPDCLFYGGKYYLYVYNTSHNGKEVFRVFVSDDLVNFTPGPVIFEWRDEYNETAIGGSSFSPNVSYCESDNRFYLFFAAVRNDGSHCRSVFYATSDSPLGPFVHDGPLEPVNDPKRIFHEIDGHPFYDDDGRIYMSFSRSEHGGSIWLEEVEFKDGKVIAKPETDTRVIFPEKEYENDGSWSLCEGGFIRKHNGLYYMIYATVCYARHYGEAYAVAKSPLGPYEKYKYNPILTFNHTLNGPGDALIVPSPDE